MKPESTIEPGDSFWSNGEASSVREEPKTTVYDLEERTARFGEAIIEARQLWMETKALHLIFARIWRSGKQSE